MHRKLVEVDEKITLVRDAKANLERLEAFLLSERARLAAQAGTFGAALRVSDAELQAQVKRADELVRKWA